MIPHELLALLALALLVGSPVLADEHRLDDHLQPFAAYVGKTWRGEFKNSTPDKPQFDVSRWEVALRGKAIRIVHSVNNGVYGGESILMWDPTKKTIAAFYFTTAGFFTEATIEFENGKMISREVVRGKQPGVTEVEAVTELTGNQMRVKSRYLKDGKWVDGHEITYVETPDALVKLD